MPGTPHRPRCSSSARRWAPRASRGSTPRTSTTSRPRARRSSSSKATRAASNGRGRDLRGAHPARAARPGAPAGRRALDALALVLQADRRPGRGAGNEMVVTMGALLADVPHSRPVPITGLSSDEGLVQRVGLSPSSYEGPTGIVGVLHAACQEAGVPTASLWASVPHYVAAAPTRRPRSRCAQARGPRRRLGRRGRARVRRRRLRAPGLARRPERPRRAGLRRAPREAPPRRRSRA